MYICIYVNIIPAGDPKQCVGSKRRMHCNDDDVSVVDGDDGDVEDDADVVDDDGDDDDNVGDDDGDDDHGNEMTSRKSSLRAPTHKRISMSCSGISRGLSISGSSARKSRGRLWGLRRTAGPRDKWQDVSWLHADTEMEWGHSTPLLKDIEVEHCCDNLPPQSHATSERLGAQCFNHGTADFYWTLQLLPGLGPVWCPEEEGLHKANQQSGNELHAVGIH